MGKAGFTPASLRGGIKKWEKNETEMARSENKELPSHGGYIKYCSPSNTGSSRFWIFLPLKSGTDFSEGSKHRWSARWGLKSPQRITPRSCEEEEKGDKGNTLISSIRHVGWAFVLGPCSRDVFVCLCCTAMCDVLGAQVEFCAFLIDTT